VINPAKVATLKPGGGTAMKFSQEVLEAHKLTLQSLQNSYAPYSGLHVAASLKIRGNTNITGGVNVENASYGGTICAERSAVVSAISQFGSPLEIEFVLVISDLEREEPIPPCGMCLQVLQEFADPDFDVYLGDIKGVKKAYKFSQLLPLAFNRQSFTPRTT